MNSPPNDNEMPAYYSKDTVNTYYMYKIADIAKSIDFIRDDPIKIELIKNELLKIALLKIALHKKNGFITYKQSYLKDYISEKDVDIPFNKRKTLIIKLLNELKTEYEKILQSINKESYIYDELMQLEQKHGIPNRITQLGKYISHIPNANVQSLNKLCQSLPEDEEYSGKKTEKNDLKIRLESVKTLFNEAYDILKKYTDKQSNNPKLYSRFSLTIIDMEKNTLTIYLDIYNKLHTNQQTVASGGSKRASKKSHKKLPHKSHKKSSMHLRT